jgi:hypothetical protein
MVFRIALVQHGAEGRGTGLVQLLLCLSYFVAISASGAERPEGRSPRSQQTGARRSPPKSAASQLARCRTSPALWASPPPAGKLQISRPPAQARARFSQGRALRGAIAAAISRAAAICAGFSTSKDCVIADISRPLFARRSTITGAGGGVTSEASPGIGSPVFNPVPRSRRSRGLRRACNGAGKAYVSQSGFATPWIEPSLSCAVTCLF